MWHVVENPVYWIREFGTIWKTLKNCHFLSFGKFGDLNQKIQKQYFPEKIEKIGISFVPMF